MISSSEYRKRLSKMRRNIYNNGKLIDRDYKYLQGAINVLAKTYDMITDPRIQAIRGPAHSHVAPDRREDQPFQSRAPQHAGPAGQAEDDQVNLTPGGRLYRPLHGHRFY